MCVKMVVVAKDLMSRKSLSILNINYRYQLFAALTGKNEIKKLLLNKSSI